MKNKSHFFHVVFKTKGGNRPGSCGHCLSRWRIAMSGGERDSHFTINSDPPERGRQWGGQWSINRQNKDCRGKTGSDRAELKWTCCEGTEWSKESNYPVQDRENPKSNSPSAWSTWLWLEHVLAQCTASSSWTWDSFYAGLSSSRKPRHSHRFQLCLWSYCRSVTAVLWMLLFWCLLTLAKKHPSIWEQQGAFKFSGGNDQAKEVITARRPWFFTYLKEKGLEQWKEWNVSGYR